MEEAKNYEHTYKENWKGRWKGGRVKNTTERIRTYRLTGKRTRSEQSRGGEVLYGKKERNEICFSFFLVWANGRSLDRNFDTNRGTKFKMKRKGKKMNEGGKIT